MTPIHNQAKIEYDSTSFASLMSIVTNLQRETPAWRAFYGIIIAINAFRDTVLCTLTANADTLV